MRVEPPAARVPPGRQPTISVLPRRERKVSRLPPLSPHGRVQIFAQTSRPGFARALPLLHSARSKKPGFVYPLQCGPDRAPRLSLFGAAAPNSIRL